MSTCQRMLSAFIFLIQANILALAQIICVNNGMNYRSNNSRYRFNLNNALYTLSANVDSNGFLHVAVGQSPDKVNALILCRGDVQRDTCSQCAGDAATEILVACPNQKQAVRWSELCMLRYSNETIIGIKATTPETMSWWIRLNDTSQFESDLQRMLSDGLQNITPAASGSPRRKVAAANVNGPQTIYLLAQCTPDLSPDNCTSCLINAAGYITRSCCHKMIGGRVLTPSCNLRFETYAFYNETRLQELNSSAPGPGPVPPILSPPGKGSGNSTRIVVIIVASNVAFVAVAAILVGILLRKRIKGKSMETREIVDRIITTESLQYTFGTISALTNNFSDDNKLGQGGFGAVYKGKLVDGREIAVKRLSKNSRQGDLEFKNEVLLLASLQHRNLVRLLGFCLEGMEKLLVYEFVPNASLDHFIFDRTRYSYLNWESRYKIIRGIARGILYLHEDSRLRIIHRDLKASNILLDGDMNPKIADFGMAILFGQDETQGNTGRIVGTYGYMAPEYIMHGEFSIKSDVFSFGVLVLEIISGKKTNCFHIGENVEGFLSFAWKNWQNGTEANIVDPFLRSVSASMNEIRRCIQIGLLCVQENAVDRPTMASVILMLNSSSISLAAPSEPAFYFAGGFDSEVRHMHDYNSRDPENNSSSKSYQKAQPDCSSYYNASITELYPR